MIMICSHLFVSVLRTVKPGWKELRSTSLCLLSRSASGDSKMLIMMMMMMINMMMATMMMMTLLTTMIRRALGRKGAHLPFRASKLTQVLRDSFIGDKVNINLILNSLSIYLGLFVSSPTIIPRIIIMFINILTTRVHRKVSLKTLRRGRA